MATARHDKRSTGTGRFVPANRHDARHPRTGRYVPDARTRAASNVGRAPARRVSGQRRHAENSRRPSPALLRRTPRPVRATIVANPGIKPPPQVAGPGVPNIPLKPPYDREIRPIRDRVDG